MVWFPVYTKERPFDSGGGGGGWEVLSWQIVFSMSSAKKIIFKYFDAKILIFIRNKIWKKKVDGGG